MTVFDQTSFSKYRLVGPDAEAALQWLCTADVAVPVGKTVYTGMLNERGTYESDVTLTRVAADEYFIVSSAATTERDKDHIGRRLGEHRATLVDVTSQYAVLGVMGPRSRELLSRLTNADLSHEASPSAPAARSPSATRPCARRGSPTSASWAGSSTCRSSSRSVSTRT